MKQVLLIHLMMKHNPTHKVCFIKSRLLFLGKEEFHVEYKIIQYNQDGTILLFDISRMENKTGGEREWPLEIDAMQKEEEPNGPYSAIKVLPTYFR